jgi:hypothetical protein
MVKNITRIFWGDSLEWSLDINPDQVRSMLEAKNQGGWFDHLFSSLLSTQKRTSLFFMVVGVNVCIVVPFFGAAYSFSSKLLKELRKRVTQ